MQSFLDLFGVDLGRSLNSSVIHSDSVPGPNCTSDCLCPMEEFAAETGRSLHGVRGRWEQYGAVTSFPVWFREPKVPPWQVPYVCLEEPVWIGQWNVSKFITALVSLTQLTFASEKYLEITPLDSQCICKLG